MSTIQETAYPQLKRHSSAQELSAIYTPSPDELALAQRQTRNPVTPLGFLIQLKTFQRFSKGLPKKKPCQLNGIKSESSEYW